MIGLKEPPANDCKTRVEHFQNGGTCGTPLLSLCSVMRAGGRAKRVGQNEYRGFTSGVSGR